MAALDAAAIVALLQDDDFYQNCREFADIRPLVERCWRLHRNSAMTGRAERLETIMKPAINVFVDRIRLLYDAHPESLEALRGYVARKQCCVAGPLLLYYVPYGQERVVGLAI